MKLEEIQALMKMFEESGLSKIELRKEDVTLCMEKESKILYSQGVESTSFKPEEQKLETSNPIINDEQEESGTWIKSPLVGTFYASISPGTKPFVEIGQKVKKGDVLCIIEAMKVMNEIHAPCDGIVRSILVTDNSMVEFDQKIIRLGELND